jgi:hypothetical protein
VKVGRTGRDALLALLTVAVLAIGCAAAASAADDEEVTLHDVVAAGVAEAYPEPVPAPAAAGGLALQPPPTSWDRVVGSTCPDPYSCEPLP